MTTLGRRQLLAGGMAAAAAAVLGACGSGGDETERATGGGAPEPAAGGDSGITTERVSYGDHDEAVADLWLPAGGGPAAVVVLIHGGFWRQDFGLDLMDGLAQSLAERGYAAWNIEYRRVGGAGGWPETFLDVAAAVDHLPDVVPAGDAVVTLDLERVAVVGHSAGGHLAAWVAGRAGLSEGAPGSRPRVRPILAVPQAGVLDLVACAEQGLGGSACPDLVGGSPQDVPDRYALASPVALVPTGVPVVCVHGALDAIVPIEQSQRYVAAARDAGDAADLVVVDDADHFSVIDPDHEAWQVVLDRLADHLG